MTDQDPIPTARMRVPNEPDAQRAGDATAGDPDRLGDRHGFELPRIRWSQLWPVLPIGIGLWVVLGSMRRGSR